MWPHNVYVISIIYINVYVICVWIVEFLVYVMQINVLEGSRRIRNPKSCD